MPHRHLAVDGPQDSALTAALEALRAELAVPMEFPAEVLAEAERAAKEPTLPSEDATDLPLVSVDPVGSRDLDQALHLERTADGYVVQYAIADVSAFVQPGGAVEREAMRRGETLYAPDLVTTLHPPVIAHDAGSLRPDHDRPALLWTIELDDRGESTGVDVRRVMVRNRAQLDYPSVQRAFDDGSVDGPLALLREVGELRQQLERERGGITLPIPEQVVVREDAGWALRYEAQLPVEGWNAQLSLMTGMAAAELMLYAEVGILRVLPEPAPEVLRQMRRVADALGVSWPTGMAHDELVRSLDPANPVHAALIATATGLLRGSGYVAFDGGVPEQALHAGIGAEYAHATAPLRRLVDRYVGEVCVALCADAEPSDHVRQALPEVVAAMGRSGDRSGRYEGGIVSIFEAAVLAGSVGEEFDAVVVEVDADRGSGTVQLADPAVTARCRGRLTLGSVARVRLVEADVVRRLVSFESVG